jgi:hydrogenase expression/formation protein HypC
MCIGLPMRVLDPEVAPGVALAEAGGQIRRITTMLLGPLKAGDHVLVHVDSAIRMLDATEAQAITDALEALDRAVDGEAWDHLLADLIDREPQLPAHLRGAG